MFYVLESPLNWGHGSEVVVQHSSIGGISASVIMWTFFLAAGQVMISHAWTVCTDAWLVGHHQPDINIYILNENFFINFKIYFEAIYLMYVLPKWFLAFLDKIWIVHTKYFEMFDNNVWKHTVLKLYINSWNHICNWQDEKKDAKKEQQGDATSGLSLNKKIFCSPILLTAFWTQRKFWFIGYCINMMYQ